MTQQDYSHFVILADRTSSTGTQTDPGRTRAMDFTDGIKDFITDQAAQPGKATFTLIEFMSTHYMHDEQSGMHLDRVLWFAASAEAERKLKNWKIIPSGSTPLIDAMVTVIDQTGDRLAALPEAERPARVYFVVATDGEENTSRKFTRLELKERISQQQDAYDWDFVFIGADFDAFAEAGGYGIAQGSTMQTNSASSASLAAAYAGTSSAVTRSRASGQSVSYSDAERTAANQKND